MTAYADEPTLQRAKKERPFGYLVKPFEDRELRGTVEMALYKITNEKQFKSHAARLEKIIASVPDGVALLDTDFRIVMANAKALDFLGNLAGAGIGDVVDQFGEHPVERLLSSSSDETWHEIRLAGSLPRIFEVSISTVHSSSDLPNGNSGVWLLVIRDITAERGIRQ